MATTDVLVVEETPLRLKTKKRLFLRRPEFWMVLAAFVIRLAVMSFLYQERLNPDRDHWHFAGETGRIAKSIVEGRGFSSPLHADTGPTAWMTPLYPLLVAGVFKTFGIYTKASALVMLSLDNLFSALTCLPVFLITRKRFGDHAAQWAGWIWAFFPYAIYFSADFIWATTLTTLMLAWIFYSALSLMETASLRTWAGFGLLCGISALIDPVALSVAAPLAAWMVLGRAHERSKWIAPAVTALAVFAVVVSPWFIRNYQVFHKIIPFRDNIGLELYVGNNGETWHFAPGGFHPSDTPREWEEYQLEGELNYMQHKRVQALAFIEAHPGFFLRISLRRAFYMWTNFWSFSRRYLQAEPADPLNIFLCTMLTVFALAGLWRAFKEHWQATMPFAIALFCFPLVYYITHPEDYYRRPIDPVFVVLAVYAIHELFQRRGSGTAKDTKAMELASIV